MPESAKFWVGDGKGFVDVDVGVSLGVVGEYVALLTGVLRGGSLLFVIVLEAELV
jgi:hypothetical protein